MEKLRIVNGLMALFVTLPIWFYLLYQLLSAVGASELSWFLYWIYVPVTMLVTFIAKLLTDD